MANLIENAAYEAGIYQIETTDPVVGGLPDLALGQGISNVPSQQLANRTAWLKAQVEALVAAGYATPADITAQINALIAAAPAALDTLNELATALGDDPDFAATMTTQLGLKLDASAYTAADVLAKLLTVDGAGSGLDADLLDGQDASAFATAAQGAKADTALQSVPNNSQAVWDAGTNGTESTINAIKLKAAIQTLAPVVTDDEVLDMISQAMATTTYAAADTWVNPSSLATNDPGYRPPNARVRIQAWGAGGGGTQWCGGGGGGYNELTMTLAELPASVPVVIGAAGTGSQYTSTNGGNSTFGTWLTGWGGGGGSGAKASVGAGGGTISAAAKNVAGEGGGAAGSGKGAVHLWGGAAGGYGNGAQQGGAAVWGGAGGGAETCTVAAISQYGGNGGANGIAPAAPGGGGKHWAGGARGEIRVTVTV